MVAGCAEGKIQTSKGIQIQLNNFEFRDSFFDSMFTKVVDVLVMCL